MKVKHSRLLPLSAPRVSDVTVTTAIHGASTTCGLTCQTVIKLNKSVPSPLAFTAGKTRQTAHCPTTTERQPGSHD